MTEKQASSEIAQSRERNGAGEPTYCECGGLLEYSRFAGRIFVVCPKCSHGEPAKEVGGNEVSR